MPVQPFYVGSEGLYVISEGEQPTSYPSNIIPFEQVYCLNETMKKFREMNSALPHYYYLLMNQFLRIAIGLFPECDKDLSSRVDFEYEIYKFNGDGVSDEFQLTPQPPLDDYMDTEWYISIDGGSVDEDDYEITVSEGELYAVFSSVPDDGSEIYIASYIVGYFDISGGLSDTELMILARLMIHPYVERNINDSKLLAQTVYSRDEHVYSQANHIREISGYLDSYTKKTNLLRRDYDYARPTAFSGTAVRT